MHDTSSSSSLDSLLAYRQTLQDTITACEKESDYRITFLSSGAIALALAYMSGDLFRATTCKGLFLAGIALEIIALLLNLSSFFYTKRVCRRDMTALDDWLATEDRTRMPDLYEKALGRARKIDFYNLLNVLLLIAGIIFSASFMMLNI